MNQILQNTKIAVIEAGWHADIVGEARKSFVENMGRQGVAEDRIDLYQVPGSLEIPLMAKKLAETGTYDVIVACGLIINGGIYRHEFVTTAVIDGMMRVQLDTGVPVLSVVLTPINFHEAKEHHDFFFAHYKKKGEEAANACVKTLQNMAMFDTKAEQLRKAS